MLLELEIEGLPPTVNHMYGGKCRYKSELSRGYQERVREQMRVSSPPYLGKVALTIEFQTRDHRRWDLDNRLKALQDCLEQSGVIADDRQIDELHVYRRYGERTVTHVQLETLES